MTDVLDVHVPIIQIGGAQAPYATIDLNNDGLPDQLISGGDDDDQPEVALYINDGKGGFQPAINVDFDVTSPLVVGTNADGGVDIFGYNGFFQQYTILQGTKDGAFTQLTSTTAPSVTGTVPLPRSVPGGVDTTTVTQTTVTVSPPAGATAYVATTYALPQYFDGSTVLGLDNAGRDFSLLIFQVESHDLAVVTGQLDVPCYVSGTCILTDRGEVAVEDLRVGDRAMALLAQGFATITWIGRRIVTAARHPRPHTVQPVRIRAGALGEARPQRDLLVSPGHALYLDGVLIQAELLVNGASIVQEAVDTVTYWHVELTRHDVLLAEGVPAESYLDVGNRGSFAKDGSVVSLRPLADEGDAGPRCAVLVREGAALAGVRQRILDRASTVFGHVSSGESGLHLLADGAIILPDGQGDVVLFHLPLAPGMSA